LIGYFGDLMPIGDAILMVMIPGCILAGLARVKLPLTRRQQTAVKDPL